jgi:hypothetical protein
MPDVPPSSRLLQHCIRDLATLNALPAMCIGRTPSEALDIGTPVAAARSLP